MAVYKIFPEKDTTIYSEFPNTNTGLDPILEVKNTSMGLTNDPQVARALIKFSSSEMIKVTDIISNTVVGTSPSLSPSAIGLYSASLKLFTSDTNNLPDNYDIYCYAVSQSWQAGTGKYLFDPPYVQDCTWYNRENGTLWATSSLLPDTTMSFLPNNPGGGSWFSTYLSSQSFAINTTKDTDIDVTPIVETFNNFLFLENNGFILKFDDQYEFNVSSSYSLKFFSRDTHTIYAPQLEFRWDDSVYNTGSLTLLTNQNVAITLGNNLGSYTSDSVCQFRVNARPIYPPRQFNTVSVFTLNSALPSSSYYAIQDLDTEEYVVNFSEEHTKISCDTAGNFFTLYTAGFQPERYYKILIKSTFDNGSSVIYDNDYIFKINK